MNCNESVYERRKPKGEITDVLRDKETGEVIERREGFNLIVDNCYKLIASLMGGMTGYAGISYWENGTGLSSWDSSPVEPDATDSGLVTPLAGARKEIQASDVNWLNADNSISLTPTNRIQIHVVFESTESNGSLREFGLFGGDATTVSNSGIMINHKIHPELVKQNTQTLERTLRLTF